MGGAAVVVTGDKVGVSPLHAARLCRKGVQLPQGSIDGDQDTTTGVLVREWVWLGRCGWIGKGVVHCNIREGMIGYVWVDLSFPDPTFSI